jgi:hypothetical protein
MLRFSEPALSLSKGSMRGGHSELCMPNCMAGHEFTLLTIPDLLLKPL